MTSLAPPALRDKPLSATQIVTLLAQLDGWHLFGEGPELAIERHVDMPNFLSAMAFANAVAYQAERHNHHPDILVTYSRCTVRFRTHDAGGITHKDFDSAARINGLLTE